MLLRLDNLLVLIKKFFFLQTVQIDSGSAHLHPALIVITTSFRACWEHYWLWGGSSFLLFLFFLENI